MSASSQDSLAAAPTQTTNRPHPPSRCSGWRVPNPLASLDPILKRDEADILFIVGNLALVAFDLIDWPIAALNARFVRDGPKPSQSLPSSSRSRRGSRVSALSVRSLGSTGRKKSCSGKLQPTEPQSSTERRPDLPPRPDLQAPIRRYRASVGRSAELSFRGRFLLKNSSTSRARLTVFGAVPNNFQLLVRRAAVGGGPGRGQVRSVVPSPRWSRSTSGPAISARPLG